MRAIFGIISWVPRRIVPSDEFTADDESALAWAASTAHPVAVATTIRLRSGAVADISLAELAAIRRDWEADGRPPPKAHVHRTPVRFADDTAVMGVRFLGDDPYLRDETPGFGLYLDENWDPPWPHEHFDWPDFGVPDDLDALRRVLTDLLDRARNGERVEVGCFGGHGRTSPPFSSAVENERRVCSGTECLIVASNGREVPSCSTGLCCRRVARGRVRGV